MLDDKKKLSEIIEAHVFNPTLGDKYEKIYQFLDLEQTQKINKIIWQIYRKEITLTDFFSRVSSLNLPQFEEKIFPEILKNDLFFLADYLDININDWSSYLNDEDFKNLKFANFFDWLKEELAVEEVVLTDDEIKKLVLVLNSSIKQTKTKEEIVNSLTKSEKIGGLNLKYETAKTVVEDFYSWFKEKENNGEIVTTQQILPKKNIAAPPTTVASVLKTTPVITPPVIKTQPQPELVKSSISKNIKADVEEMQKTLPDGTIKFVSNSFDFQAEEIIKSCDVAVRPELAQRFKSLIISYLREIRKSSEIRERLLAHTLNGGIGLTPEQADKVIKTIEGFKKKEMGSVVKEIKKPETAIILEPPLEIAKTEINSESNLIPQVKTEAPAPIEKKQAIIEPKTEPVVSASRNPVKLSPVQLPSSSDIKTAAPVLKIIEEKNKPKIEKVSFPEEPPKPPKTMAIPQTTGGRAKVEDVAYKPRLIGPIEELKEMNLVEFRRISPKPRVAADKIISKIELLAKEGYEKKIKGIEAWRKSQLCQLYNSLLSESLNKAKPVAEVIKDRVTAKQETLSEDEFKVIMDLNRQLKF